MHKYILVHIISMYEYVLVCTWMQYHCVDTMKALLIWLGNRGILVAMGSTKTCHSMKIRD
jgi:hypothetical protein